MLQLETLGVLRLTGPEGPVLAGRRKELALLAYLARHAGRVVSRAELATLLWGERDEARARHSLRQALAQLRRVLGDALEVRADEVALRGGVTLDVARFEAAVAAGRADEAVAAWQGEFLEAADDTGGESYRLWVEGERVVLRTRLAAAFDAIVARAERRGVWDEAAAAAERWADALPLDEDAQLHLIQALRLAGRTDDACARYAGFEARLRDAIDREPSPELRRVGRQLTRHAATERREVTLSGSTALHAPAFAGRGLHFAELVAAWQAAERGGLAIALVEGEAGIGRTRLCRELLRWVAARATERASEPPCMLSAGGSAVDAGRPRPWDTARDLLTPLASARGLAGAPPEALAALATVIPAVREAFPALPEAPRDVAALHAGIARTIADVASESPVVVFVDDLPRADADSQRLVVALASDQARLLAGARVLLLVCARAGEDDDVGAMAALRATRAVRRLRLPPLSRADVLAMVSSMVTLVPDDAQRLAARLHEESGGNPLHVVELVAALVDAGRLVPGEDGGWRLATGALAPPLPLPPRNAVARRRGAATRGLRLTRAAAAALAATALLMLASALPGRHVPPTPVLGSVAVLPLVHASRDTSSTYLTAGITDELIAALDVPGGVRVVGRSSVAALADQRLDARQVGARLGVDAVLQGTVSTDAGRLRTEMALVDSRTGSRLWSAAFERPTGDLVTMPDDVARAVIAALRGAPAADSAMRARAMRARARRAPDAVAHDLYLRARHFDNRSGAANLRRAIDYFEQAIARDSTYAEAYAGLAASYLTLFEWNETYSATAVPARAFAERALRLDPGLAAAHEVLARLHRHDWRWADSEREFAYAIAAAPGAAGTRHAHAHLLMALGRTAEALAESERALALDPVNPRIAMHLCWHHYMARDYRAALAACEDGLELDPNFPDSHSKLAWVYLALGRNDDALAAVEHELAISDSVPEYVTQLAMVHARAGRPTRARALLGEMRERTPEAHRPLVTEAAVELALADVDSAFVTLERAYARHHAELAQVPTEPSLLALHGDPRFAVFVRRIGLPVPAPPR